MDISVLNLTNRTSNALRRAKINTIQDIAENYNKLSQIRTIGVSSIAEIRQKISPYIKSEPIVNERGVKVSCFGYETDEVMEWCKILKDWYNPYTKELCKDCPFYKTPEQVAAGK